MSFKKRLYIYVILSFISMGIVNARSITIQQTIDWPEFMSSQDMIWEVLPEYWHESAYLGNGRLGLMIYKEPEKNYIRFETSNCDVHDHREKRDVFGTPRLLTGHFALHPEGEIISGKMRLDLWNAEATTDIVTTKGAIHLKTFVHADDMIMIVKATTEGEEKNFQWEWIAAEANSPRYLFFKNQDKMDKIPQDYQLNPAAEISQKNDINLSTQKLLAGGETVVGWQESKAEAARQRKKANDLKKLEASIEELENRIAEIDEQFLLPENATNVGLLNDLTKQRNEADTELNELYTKWEELSEED